MRTELLEYLTCPSCGGNLEIEAESFDHGHVMAGSLTCRACSAIYSIERGVPRLNVDMDGLERVAQTFSYEWKAHHDGKLEKDGTLWGLTAEEDWSYFGEATGLRDDQLDGAMILDAGCGSGRLTRMMAERHAKAVIGVDMIDAVDGAFARTRDLANVHIVQGNIFELPLRRRIFDLVWSQGVIHHTPDAQRAHTALAAMVKPGGLLYVWVYAKRFNPFRFTKDVLDMLHVTDLSEPNLMRLSKMFAFISVGLHRSYKLIRRIPTFRPQTRWAKRTLRQRTMHELSLTWFDALSPAYDSRHTESEVVAWFEALGFNGVSAIEEPKVGVRGTAPSV